MTGPIQAAISNALTAVSAATIAGKKLSEDKKPSLDPKSSESGIDAKMALKARRVVQQKINAIYANKSLSGKAMTRRVGQAIDEYKKTIGGDK